MAKLEMLSEKEKAVFIPILDKHLKKFEGRKITEILQKEVLEAFDEAWEEFEKERRDDSEAE